jgi:hypothetical protein
VLGVGVAVEVVGNLLLGEVCGGSEEIADGTMR